MSDTIQGKVLGFRTWTVQDGELITSSGSMGWIPGTNRARCKRGQYEAPIHFGMYRFSEPRAPTPKPHTAPGHDCTCGIYAWYHQQHEWVRSGLNWDRSEKTGSVVGALLAWGQVEAQPTGFRAEYAEPVVLAYDESCGLSHIRQIEEVASTYGTLAVRLEDLADAAKEFGSPIPENMRPVDKPKELPSPKPGPGGSMHYSGYPVYHHHYWSGTGSGAPSSESPPRRRFHPAIFGANAGAALTNLGFGVAWGHWWSFLAAGVSAGFAGRTGPWRKK